MTAVTHYSALIHHSYSSLIPLAHADHISHSSSPLHALIHHASHITCPRATHTHAQLERPYRCQHHIWYLRRRVASKAPRSLHIVPHLYVLVQRAPLATLREVPALQVRSLRCCCCELRLQRLLLSSQLGHLLDLKTKDAST